MTNQTAPLVSILMPVYNASKYIDQAINSIIDQSYLNIELLILNDGSTDNSKDIIAKYRNDRVFFFDNKINQGYLKSINFLFEKANGDLVTFQDADDWSDKRRIQLQVQAFEKDPELGLCGCNVIRIDEFGNKLWEKNYNESYKKIRTGIPFKNQFCGATIMFKQTIYKVIGGYDPIFNRIANEDYDWSYRMVEKYKASNIPDHLYFVRHSKNSISRKVNDPKQFFSSELVQFRAKKRQSQLINAESDVEFLEKKIKPFMLDKSLIYRRNADHASYNQMWHDLLVFSLKAFQANPCKLINLKYLLSSLINYLKHFKPKNHFYS